MAWNEYSEGLMNDYYDGEQFQDEDESEQEDDLDDDGQPSEYTEWQDFMGGDDSDYGQFSEG